VKKKRVKKRHEIDMPDTVPSVKVPVDGPLVDKKIEDKKGTSDRDQNKPVLKTQPQSFIDRATSPMGIVGIVIAIIVISCVAYLYAIKSPLLFPRHTKISIAPTPIPTPTPTPRPIPHGPKGFSVSQSDKTVPQFGSGTIDPYDPAIGATETITVAVRHTIPVTKVTAVLKTDHTISAPIPFTLKSGTSKNGQWSASLHITDTYFYTYGLVLQAGSVSGPGASVEITLR
jgi:hypothetical protein